MTEHHHPIPTIGRRTLLAGVGATAVAAAVGIGVASSAEAGGFRYPKLRPGVRHRENVLLLKSWLKMNGYNPSYGSLLPLYDRKTVALVRHFQVRCALTTDGIVGPKTWCALIAHPAHKVTLRRGSRRTEVQDLQMALNARFSSGLSSDGVFGGNTEREVRRYQRMVGLAADGVVGAKTWQRLSIGR
ncbi:peptidoglycan-binding domain-containing protein [Luteipulveratus halotolerans]|uniref:peptidoglycan-binding domain-containing protein n=1 Tax=Luteipulveratus halotolerans TaxID=1631356 RepID=UPI00067FF9F0|nr:peptidoglycan-binding protein [Luteipulveratus halotolerans]